MTEDAAAKTGRTEKMGLLGAVSYIIGNIVGSGIFITPATIVSLVSSVGLSLVVWMLSAFIATLGAFCYVELGTSIRKSGADFAYLCYVKWYPIAFAFMCTGCIIIYPATLAIQADTFSEYVFKGINITMENDTQLFFAKKLTGFSLIWFLLFLNFFSLKTFVSRFQIVASIAKIAATALVIGTGLYYLFFKGWTQNIQDPFGNSTFDVGTFVAALFSGLYSYDGWDILNFGAEEIDNPKRTMPLSIVFGMSFIAILYLFVNFSYFIVIPIPDMLSSPAVAQTFGDLTLGSFSFIIPVFVALLLIGSLNSTMFSASRYLQAAAKQGHLPSCISCINPISDSPRVALLVHVILAMGISFAGDLNQLINYVSFSQWSQRGCTMAALIYIRFTHKPVHPDRIRTFILMPLLFCLICWTLVVVTIVDSFDVSVVGIGIVLAGFVFFFLFIFEKSLPAIPAYRDNSRKLNETITIWSQIIFNVMPELDFGEEEDNDLHKIYPEVPPLEGSIACEDGVKRRVSALSCSTQSTASSTRF